mmetsp:Transcript_29452/g.47337  ORF Transcript_29452/g.47337 Transcript_29452/m.47337 type:complete len:232 (+) Transcript_29452:842-1537(+)
MNTQLSTTLFTSSSLSSATSPKKVFATELSASRGHSLNQSMVQQLTSAGNMRRRWRNSSLTGDMARTQCKLERTRVTKKEFTAFFVAGKPRPCMMGRKAAPMVSVSSVFHRLGTSPELRMLLMSSKKFSCTICVSVKRNTTFLPSEPAMRSTLRKSSRHSFLPYPLATSIWNSSNSSSAVARRVRLWRPDPPTPSNRAFPNGNRITRHTRLTCSMASRNITSCMGALVTLL